MVYDDTDDAEFAALMAELDRLEQGPQETQPPRQPPMPRIPGLPDMPPEAAMTPRQRAYATREAMRPAESVERSHAMSPLSNALYARTGNLGAARTINPLGQFAEAAAPIAAEVTMLPQLERTGRAGIDAYRDPSLANLANLAGNIGITAAAPARSMKPIALGAGALGAAYLEAMRRDGYFSPSAAQAQTMPASADVELPTRRPDAAAIARSEAAADLDKKRSHEIAMAAAVAAATEREKQKTGSQARIEEADAARAREEFNKQVAFAEASRDRILAREAVPKFTETDVGKVYRATSGITPMLFGAGAGLLARAATGPGKTVAGKIAKDWAIPIGTGASTGIGFGNAPLYHEMTEQPYANPVREAYDAYARELPPTHPRKQEWLDYAARQPPRNPAQKAAYDEFWNNLYGRSAAFALEGGAGGKLGAMAASAAGRAYNAAGQKIGKWTKPPRGPRRPPDQPPRLPGDGPTPTADIAGPPPAPPRINPPKRPPNRPPSERPARELSLPISHKRKITDEMIAAFERGTPMKPHPTSAKVTKKAINAHLKTLKDIIDAAGITDPKQAAKFLRAMRAAGVPLGVAATAGGVAALNDE